jgi:hypothetical protein
MEFTELFVGFCSSSVPRVLGSGSIAKAGPMAGPRPSLRERLERLEHLERDP